MTKLYDLFCRVVLGKNTKYTSADMIVDQLNEPRPLPIGITEFNEWSERIISGALITADKDSQLYALSTMILTLGPHESHKPDAYFIHGLRKSAANEIADAKRRELYNVKKAREADEKAKEAAKANPEAEATLARAKNLQLVGNNETAAMDNKKV